MRQALSCPLIQVAGVADRAEAAMLVDCGVRYLGFPLRLPVNPVDLTEDEAGDIIRTLPPPVRGVVITYLDRADAIADFCRTLGARMVQVHGDITTQELARLHQRHPELTIVKSLVIGRHPFGALARMALDFAPYVDAFLTDTYAPDTGAAGATGRTHDWTLSRRLVELSPRPVILAGGLTPRNVRQAVSLVRPAGVDVHTGVEDACGRKERSKVLAFVAEATAGFGGA